MDSVRQSKKMKKRRDLDKLLTVNGRGPLVSKRRRNGEGSSSEDAESANLKRKDGRLMVTYPQVNDCSCNSRCCCSGFIVTTLFVCVVALAGFGWLYVQLTKQLDYVQHKLYNLDHIRGEVNDVMLRVLELERVTSLIMSSDLPQIKANVSDIYKQLTIFNSTIRRVNQTMGVASELSKLPRQSEQLSKVVAELGSSVESLHQHQLSTDEQVDFINEQLQIVQHNSTTGERYFESMLKNLNESMMNQWSAVNSTIFNVALEDDRQKSVAARLTNDTELLRELFNSDHQQLAELMSSMKQTVPTEESTKHVEEYSFPNISEFKQLKDKIDNLNVQCANFIAMESSMKELKQSVSMLTTNFTNQVQSLHDVSRRLTVVELTVDDVIPSRHGDQHVAAVSQADERLLESGLN